MIALFKFFDAYTIRARIVPSLIAGLPALAFPFVVVPWDHIGLSNVIVSIMSFVLLFAVADLARRRGRQIEKKLGTRSTLSLWYRSNSELPNSSKNLYRTFIAGKLKCSAPSEEDEINEPQLANDFYAGAGDWLRDHTRDAKKFKILFDENITYGFRRNLLGLKSIALVLNGIVAILSGFILYLKPAYFESNQTIEEKLYVVLLVVATHSVYIFLAVNDSSVREASKAYGKQLI
jgi:hypothetical protein